MPDLQDKLGGAGDKDVRDKGVPLDVVDRGAVSQVGAEVLRRVLGCCKVH